MWADFTEMRYKPLVMPDRSTWFMPEPTLMVMAALYTSLPAMSVMLTLPVSDTGVFQSRVSLLLAGLGKAITEAVAAGVLLTASFTGVIVLDMVCCIKLALLTLGVAALIVELWHN